MRPSKKQDSRKQKNILIERLRIRIRNLGTCIDILEARLAEAERLLRSWLETDFDEGHTGPWLDTKDFLSPPRAFVMMSAEYQECGT